MLNELLARVQAYADERQFSLHRGTIQRVVYSAQDIVDGQYLAIAIHFDRDREVLMERFGKVDNSWVEHLIDKIDHIDTLDYDLHAYHSLYTHLVEAHITKARAIEILSDEKLLRKYEQAFRTLYDAADEADNDYWNLLLNIVFDIDMVRECKA